MSFPIVNGMLIDTVDDTNKSPTAIPRGFFSGFASETMARNDEALFAGSSPDVEMKRENSERFGFAGTLGTSASF